MKMKPTLTVEFLLNLCCCISVAALLLYRSGSSHLPAIPHCDHCLRPGRQRSLGMGQCSRRLAPPCIRHCRRQTSHLQNPPMEALWSRVPPRNQAENNATGCYKDVSLRLLPGTKNHQSQAASATRACVPAVVLPVHQSGPEGWPRPGRPGCLRGVAGSQWAPPTYPEGGVAAVYVPDMLVARRNLSN